MSGKNNCILQINSQKCANIRATDETVYDFKWLLNLSQIYACNYRRSSNGKVAARKYASTCRERQYL